MVGQTLLAIAKSPVITDYDYELQELDQCAEQEFMINNLARRE